MRENFTIKIFIGGKETALQVHSISKKKILLEKGKKGMKKRKNCP
jgi:hypothetical protein